MAWAGARGWRVSVQGRKVYAVPGPLTKSAAVRELADRLGAGTVLAAGDSLLDADLLEAADLGVMPPHGELAATGWAAPHVAVTPREGVLGGEDVATWFLAQVRAASLQPAPPSRRHPRASVTAGGPSGRPDDWRTTMTDAAARAPRRARRSSSAPPARSRSSSPRPRRSVPVDDAAQEQIRSTAVAFVQDLMAVDHRSPDFTEKVSR